MKESKIIHPKNHQFAFQFDKGECYEKLNGKCSLFEEFDINNITQASTQRNTKEYCQKLYAAMLKKSYFVNGYIHHCGCGHFDFTDGRHRVCIAQKKELPIEIDISSGFELCLDCENTGVKVKNMSKKQNFLFVLSLSLTACYPYSKLIFTVGVIGITLIFLKLAYQDL